LTYINGIPTVFSDDASSSIHDKAPWSIMPRYWAAEDGISDPWLARSPAVARAAFRDTTWRGWAAGDRYSGAACTVMKSLIDLAATPILSAIFSIMTSNKPIPEAGSTAGRCEKRRPSSRHQVLTDTTSVVDSLQILADPLIDIALKSVVSIQQQGDPECLHKLRVALRRMRSLWWAYEPLLDAQDAAFRRSEFKRVADAAGETRNWDVLRAILESNRPWPIAIAPLLLWIDEHRAGAVSRSRNAMDERDIKQMLHDALNGAVAQLTSGAPHPSLGNFARERVSAADKMLRKRWKRASKAQAEDYAELHQVRIAGKKVRYLLEFFLPVVGKRFHRTVERLELVQEELGKLNDVVANEALIRQFEHQPGSTPAVQEVLQWIDEAKRRDIQKAYGTLRSLSETG
jgi:CHAD domain-containing protein